MRPLLGTVAVAFGAIWVALPSGAAPVPARFDLVCTAPIHFKDGSKFMDAKFLRTFDRTAGNWCEATCSTVLKLREEPGRLILDDRRVVGYDGSYMTIDLRTLTASRGGKRETCKLRPFSGFRQRPPPF